MIALMSVCYLEEKPPVLIPVFVWVHVVALIDVASLVVHGPPVLVGEQLVNGSQGLEPLLKMMDGQKSLRILF